MAMSMLAMVTSITDADSEVCGSRDMEMAYDSPGQDFGGGHGILFTGGHWNSLRAAANSPHWRPGISPPVLS
jgi:hypothetical protein